MNDDINKFLRGELGVMTLTKLARLLKCPNEQAEFVLAKLMRENKIYQVKLGEWYPKAGVLLRMNGGRLNGDTPSQVKPPKPSFMTEREWNESFRTVEQVAVDNARFDQAVEKMLITISKKKKTQFDAVVKKLLDTPPMPRKRKKT